MSVKKNAHQLGKYSEQAALEYLKKQGLTELERNYTTKSGEIDLIMLHNDIVVFVEVRARTNSGYINAVETIDRKKIRRIILASQQYLQNQPGTHELYRFDIVTLTGNIHTQEVDWIKNAFTDE